VNNNPIIDKSFAFAIRIVRLYEYLCEDKRKYVLSKQLLRSGTSIGANVSEALQGQSKKDFISKMNIALKECAETEYWIRLFAATGYINGNESESILSDCVELGKLLTSIVKTSSRNV
jgi:four helix bundle protein